MGTLQEIIPQILIPHVAPLRPPPPRASTEPYAPLTAPPRHHVPYWILHSPTLANSMMERLHTYLTTAPGRAIPPSLGLQARLNDLPNDLLHSFAGELSSEETTSKLFDLFFHIIQRAVEEVDQNPTRPTVIVNARTLYSQTPGALISSTLGASPRLHREDKSWTVFDTFAQQILVLAQHDEDGQLGTSLELRISEADARSIIMKIGVSMIGGPDLIPYGILFGGHKFMIFSLFRNGDTLGEVRYGLACSDIIDCMNTSTPFLPLVIFTLLGNTNNLHQPAFIIPPVPSPVVHNSEPVTRRKFWNFLSTKPKGKVIIHIHTPIGAVSRSFLLHREPTSAFHASFVEIEISLTECIGHGASGQVFIGTMDNKQYIVKIAPWKIGRPMLQREARIYKILSDLQGRCIPRIYGFFGSEHLKALIMDYMGHTVENVADLSMEQRHQLLEELCLIHEHGIQHGDLRASNIVLQNGSAHFIDFSHGYEHQCTGHTTCFELVEARQFLLLDLEQVPTGQ